MDGIGQDLKLALRWIKEHAAELGGDPDFVAVTGGSAGGHLSALLALSAGEPAFQPGFESFDARVAACVPFYGVYDFTNRFGHDFPPPGPERERVYEWLAWALGNGQR